MTDAGTEVTSTDALNDNNRHFAVMVYDWWKIYWYIDGSIDSNMNGVTKSNYFSLTNRKMCIGNGQWGGECLDWMVDEVWLWTRALSSSEVSSLYNWWAWLAYPFTTSTFIPKIIQF